MITEILRLDQSNSEMVAARVGEVLRSGKIAAFPTDTVYGLGAVFSDAGAVRNIFAAKGRPEQKPLSILVGEPAQVDLLAQEIPRAAAPLMENFWPGALTLIFRKKESARIPDEVTAGGDTIGVRMPDCRITREIIKAAGMPLAAPSANLSGRRSAVTGQEVLEDLNGRIDLLVDAGSCQVGVSSTVLDLSGTVPRLLREGTITRRMLEEIIGMNVL